MPGTIERAFGLAKSGDFTDIGEIGRQLAREGFDDVQAHLAGAGIKRQLAAMMKTASNQRQNRPGVPALFAGDADRTPITRKHPSG